MLPALTWLKEHWRPVAIAAAVLVAFCAGLSVRRPAPRIEYRDRVVVQEKVVEHQVVKTVTVEAKTEDKQRVTHRVETTRPDGTRVVELDTATDAHVDLHVGQLATVDLSREATATVTHETQLVQTSAAPPRWRVGALAGLSTHGPVYGGEGSVRLVGPIWAGAWVLTSPAGGVSVGVEW
jgi:hypothetical protein